MQKFSEDTWRPQRVDDPEEFLRDHPHAALIDTFNDQVAELHKAIQPGMSVQDYANQLRPNRRYFWVSWRNVLVVLLPPCEYSQLVNSRNRLLITDDERRRLRGKAVGFAGLSVGSRVLEPLAHGPELGLVRLADMDGVSGSSLNRLPASIADLGTPKIIMAARQLTGVWPTATVQLFPDGLSTDSLESFLAGLDVVVCAMDDPRMKLSLRETAARLGVDVIMGTDVEQGLIDFEPYATEPSYQPFHGDLSAATLATLHSATQPHPSALIAAIAEIVGLRNLTLAGLRMAVALAQGQITSMSQLATTATSVGGRVARLIHLRLMGRSVRTGRIFLGDETTLSGPPPYSETIETEQLIGILTVGFQPAPRTA